MNYERLGYLMIAFIAWALVLTGCVLPTDTRYTQIECDIDINLETGEITYKPRFIVNETGVTYQEAIEYCKDKWESENG